MNIIQQEIDVNAPTQPLSEAERINIQLSVAIEALKEISEGRAMFGLDASEDLASAMKCATRAIEVISDQDSA